MKAKLSEREKRDLIDRHEKICQEIENLNKEAFEIECLLNKWSDEVIVK